MSQLRHDYVAVGHVTCDVVIAPDDTETRRPGGTAFYSALQAARLGLRAKILTQGVPSQIEQLLGPYRDELDLLVIPAPQTTTLATRSAAGSCETGAAPSHVRSQRVIAWAGPIEQPPDLDAAILHLAPVARETPASWRGAAGFVGLTAQGLVREWPAGEIGPVELDPALLPEHFDAAVISEHERPYCDPLLAAARTCGACVAVTAGSGPVEIHACGPAAAGHARRAAPPAIAVRDDLGAGDVFAAAFFVALWEGREPLAAASFANAAAAVRIAGEGAAAIGTRAQIEALPA